MTPINCAASCPHQLPAGISASIWISGYGIRICTLVTPLGVFEGSGHSEWTALSNAKSRAREAGVWL